MIEKLQTAARVVYESMSATTERRWPLLEQRCGAEVWVKHENQTPVGSFKVRGGLFYLHQLMRGDARPDGLIAATRGNHGQSIAFAARRYRLPVAVVVPEGNSADKNRSMVGLGAELMVRGHDFQASLEAAEEIARTRRWLLVPSFDDTLVAGVATYAFELLQRVPTLDTLYVPIGLGSGICGAIAARDALGLGTRIVGVVSSAAPAYARSLQADRVVSCNVSTRIADGVACRTPVPQALAIIRRGAERVVEVSDDQVEHAMRVIYDDTHSVAEGAGATGVAALLSERGRMEGRTVAVVLTGANIDRSIYARVLAN